MKFKSPVSSTKDTPAKSTSPGGALRFAMTKTNYMILIAGVVLLIIGYALMSGGGSADPKVFDESIFSERRITVAPIVVLIGYVVIGVSIMYCPKTNS